MGSVLGAAVVTTLAVVLGLAGAAKFQQPVSSSGAIARLGPARASVVVRALAVAELAVGLLALFAPARISGFVLAAMFAAFGVVHIHAWLSGGGDCGCFGEQSGGAPSPRRAARVTGRPLVGPTGDSAVGSACRFAQRAVLALRLRIDAAGRGLGSARDHVGAVPGTAILAPNAARANRGRRIRSVRRATPLPAVPRYGACANLAGRLFRR
jgi:hypothetical protein